MVCEYVEFTGVAKHESFFVDTEGVKVHASVLVELAPDATFTAKFVYYRLDVGRVEVIFVDLGVGEEQVLGTNLELILATSIPVFRWVERSNTS